MAEPLSNGNVTNIYNSRFENFANRVQDKASQNHGADGGAISQTQGNGKLVQADGEGLLRSLLGPTASKLGQELGQMAGIQAYFWKMDLLQAFLEKAADKMQRLSQERYCLMKRYAITYLGHCFLAAAQVPQVLE